MKTQTKEMTPEEIKGAFGYDEVDDFSEGVALVCKDKKWFHVDKNGEPIYKKKYHCAGSFRDGVAYVFRDGDWIKINKKGEEFF